MIDGKIIQLLFLASQLHPYGMTFIQISIRCHQQNRSLAAKLTEIATIRRRSNPSNHFILLPTEERDEAIASISCPSLLIDNATFDTTAKMPPTRPQMSSNHLTTSPTQFRPELLSFGFTLIPIIHTNVPSYLCTVYHTYVWPIVWRVAPMVWLVRHSNHQWI